MATKKKVMTLVVEEGLQKRLDDYRFENRFPTMSEAIRALLKKALDDEAAEKKHPSLFAGSDASDPHEGKEPGS